MPPKVDELETLMGAFGKYQLRLTLIVYAVKVSIAFNQICIVFMAPKMSFTCDGTTSKCPCSNPVYDTSQFTRTIINEWNLICERRWLVSLSQALFQFGTLLGSIFFGMAADKYGRRKPLLIAIVIQLAGGIGVAYAPSYWSFGLLRFIVGLSVGGTMVTSFVIIMEFIGAKHREVVAALYQLPFNTGHMLLPVIAYFVRDFRNYQLALLFASVILLSYFCLIPETPRWLLATKKTEAAVKIITRVAEVNKRPTDGISYGIQSYVATMERNQLKKGTVFDLFRTPNLRKNIICMSMNWWGCSYCFYGVSQYIGQLSGNVFVNVLAGAGFSTMGTLLSIPLMKVMGRRTILISQNTLAAACLLLLAINKNETVAVILAAIGVMASFIVFVLVYLYCGEVFPTVVRNAAVGFCSMMARVGSIIAPFVIDTKEFGTWVPPLLFAVFPLLGAVLAYFLPETKGRELMNTLAEAEEHGK